MTSARTFVTSPAVWHAHDMADPGQWTVELSDAERYEIVDATKRAHEKRHTMASIVRDDFELPSLAPKVAEWVDVLHRGRGFVLLRRFPTDLLPPEAVELAYAGLGVQLGTPVGQDAAGSLLGHVRDEGVRRESPAVRLYRTRERQDFHTDGSDIVGLLCLQRARAGGESRIASSYAVHNEILRTRPDLIEVLYEPMYWDRNDEQSSGEPAYYPLPVLNDVDGLPRFFYIGWYIRDAQRHPDAPRLTREQSEAMETIEATANDPRFYVEMDFQPGDIQFIANAKILHSREAYEDDEDPDRRRHLLRLWLTAHDFASVDDTLRAGIPPRVS